MCRLKAPLTGQHCQFIRHMRRTAAGWLKFKALAMKADLKIVIRKVKGRVCTV